MLKRLFVVLMSFSLLAPTLASAEPEITSNLALGGGVVLYDDPQAEGAYDGSHGTLRMGLSSSFVFLRENNRDFGLGVYTEVMTSSFHDVMPGAGMTLVLPVHHAAPIVLFAGAHYDFDGDHAGGFGGRLWWGAHNHNHFHVYNITLGFWIEARANVWGNRDLVIAAGVDIDLQVLCTPWLWFARWAHGPARL